MPITRQTVAARIAAYLCHETTLAELVDWSEQVLLNGDIAEADLQIVSSVVARLGVADVRDFGLSWDVCNDLLRQLGFSPKVELVALA